MLDTILIILAAAAFIGSIVYGAYQVSGAGD